MARRSTVRRVEEFVLFDVLYEDGTHFAPQSAGLRTRRDRWRLPAKPYIEALDRQIAEISGKPRTPIKSLSRVRRR